MKRIETILLRAREDLYSHFDGRNIALSLGQGYDFAELRSYELGDDIRYISWIHAAKQGELSIKKMYQERELNVVLVSLLDGRFLIENKREVLLYTLAVLGYSAYEGGDRLQVLNGIGSVWSNYPFSKGQDHLHRALTEIESASLLGLKINYRTVVKSILSTLQEKSLLIVLGDHLDILEISQLAQHHEVVLLAIRASQEEDPKVLTHVELVNPQNKKIIRQGGLGKHAIRHYVAQREAHDRTIQSTCDRYGVRWTKLFSVDEVLPALVSMFGLRT